MGRRGKSVNVDEGIWETAMGKFFPMVEFVDACKCFED